MDLSQVEGLTTEQESKIKEMYSEQEKVWEGKANENANKILDSVGQKFESQFGINRLSNETKVIDFLNRGVEELGKKSKLEVEEQLKSLESEKKSLQTKLDEGINDKTEFDKMNGIIANLNKEIDSYKNTLEEVKTKHQKEKTEIQLNNGFRDSMPELDKDVNKYELKERKKEAIQKIKDKYDLSVDEKGRFTWTNPENLRYGLVSELLEEELKDILAGNKNPQGGQPKHRTGGILKFTKDMNTSTASEIIKSNLKARGIDRLSKQYSEEYQKLFDEYKKLK